MAAVLAISLQSWAEAPAAQAGAEQKSRVAARVTEAVDDTRRVALRGNVHPKARAEFDRGAISDAQPITRMLLLLQRSQEQEAELRQLMEEQQSKNSPNYHAWLTPDQFGRQFGPADADIQAVTDWLTSHGFQISKVSKGRTLVEFSGNAGQVRNAFATEIHKYDVRGEEHLANAQDPKIPAALAPVVRGVVALHNFRPKSMLHNLGTFQRNAKTGEVRPAFTFSDINGTFYAVGPADFAKIYNIPAGADGTGQSIAIVGQSNINLQDVADFRTVFGLPANVPQVILNGPDPGLVSGDETESDLDVQWAGAAAPNAQIIFVTTQSTGTDFVAGVDASAQYIVDNNVAPVLSESYGSCELALTTAGNAFYNTMWQQAAAEGITVLISSGDNGSAGCDDPNSQTSAVGGLAVSGFASTPFNVSVGGTDFDDKANPLTYWNDASGNTTPGQASAKGYIPETTWNDSCAGASTPACSTVKSTGSDLVAGSGGPSNCATSSGSGVCGQGYAKPSWQQGITPTDGVRDTPDVSFFASDGNNGNFYIICEADQDITGDTGCSLTKFVTTAPFHDFQAVGGTSASTPAFAAIIALINQAKGGRQGNANYALYNTYSIAKAAGNVCNSSTLTPAQLTSNTCVFYDTTKGNISVACKGGSPNCSNVSTSANQFGFLATAKGGAMPAFNTAANYDLATGLGSVNVANLLTAWVSPSRTPSTVTLNLSNASPTLGANVTVSGLVAAGTATGIVLLENSATGAVIPANPGSSNAVTAGGNYSFPTAFLPAGSYNVIAHYGGDGTFAGSNSPTSAVNITKQNSQVLVSFVTFTGANGATPVLSTSAQSVPYGSPYILRVDVQNASGTPCENFQTAVVSFVCPTGTVQLFDGTNPLNDFPSAQTPNATNAAKLNDRGFAEDQPIQLVPGAYSITATYTPDANSSYNAPASASNTLAVTITKAATTAAVTSNVTSITAGGSVTLTATISTKSNGAGPTGTVQFLNGSSNLGAPATCTPTPATASSSGTALCTATLTTALSQFVPLPKPRTRPQIPVLPLGILCLLLIALLAMQRRLSLEKRVGYAAAGLLLLACVAAGFAGCSGSGGGGGGGGTPRSITATYSGDANYTSSTSPATTITIR